MHAIALPAADEHIAYYGKYIALLSGDVYATLESQGRETARLLAATSEAKGAHRYAPGKWSVKQVVGHIADGERVFAYRALRFARADPTPLPGFDENVFAATSGADKRTLGDLAAELASVRAASLTLFGSFDAETLLRRGSANDAPVSVRALAAIIAGHERHHVNLLIERYGLVRS